jgi:cytochrome d ubiquinol oxidase subunit II
LILRGIAIEFRNHIESLAWQPLWDAVFAGSSALLTIFFGAALGNVVRGVPLDRSGEFFLPLWTDFAGGKETGILDWYTVLVAVAAFLALAVHGALWVALKTEGEVERRAGRAAKRLWWGLAVGVVAITAASFHVQPHLKESYAAHPWGYVFPLAALVGLAGMRMLNGHREGIEAFLSSCLFLLGMLTSAAFGLYPYVLPSNRDAAQSLTVLNTAAAPYGLRIGLLWFIPGMLLTACYFVYSYRSFAGKVKLSGG